MLSVENRYNVFNSYGGGGGIYFFWIKVWVF